jgi:ribosomal protein S6
MEDAEKTRKEYEIGILVRKEDDIPEMRRVVEQHGGEFASDFQAKKIALAYKIKHETEAIFASARFSAEPASVKQLEHDLTTANIVLRSLITVPFKISRRDAVGASKKRAQQAVRQPVPAVPQSGIPSVHTLSNEALTKKIEEMLQ